MAADQVHTIIQVDQDKDKKVVDKDFEKHIYDSLKDIVEAQGYEVIEKAIVKAKLKQHGIQEMAKKLDADMIVSVAINFSEGGMEETLYEQELREYKESAGYSSYGSGKPGPVSYSLRSKKKYLLAYKWILARSDKIVHMGIIGGNSKEELEDELRNNLTKFMSGFTYLKGHVLKKEEDFIEINLCKEDGVETSKQITLFIEEKNGFKDVLKFPGKDNSVQAKITEVSDESSFCLLPSESLSEIKEGNVVEYITKTVSAESKEQKNLFQFFMELF